MSEQWPLTKLGDIISLEYGKPLSKEDRDPEGAFPVYGANGEKARSNRFYHSSQTIIVGRKGSAGELNLTEGKFWPLDVTYFVTFDKEKYEMKFLYYLLQTLNLPSMAKGVKPGINRNDVYALEVRIPSKEVQQRIVSILDEAFENIHSSTKIAELELFNTSGMLNSVLDHLFEEIIHDATMKSLDELTDEDSPITYGVVKPGPEGTILFVRGGDVSNGQVHTSGLRTITESVSKQYSRTVLRGREILVSLVGQPGQIGIVPPSLAGANIARQVGRIRLREGINEEFVMMYLRSESAQQSLRSVQGGSVQQVINLRDLRKILVPVVNIEQQLRIADIAQNMASEIELLADALSDKISQFSELKQSILQEAFNGKLTGGIAA